MTRIVLEVSQDRDLNLLLALLERLNIRVIQTALDQEIGQPAEAKADRDFILKGLPARQDFDDFFFDFEDNRKDRPLPGREQPF